MPAAPIGLAGAIGDPAASQALGGLCTGIGFGYNNFSRPNAAQNPGNFAVDAFPQLHRIGSTPTEEAFAASIGGTLASKRLRYKVATGAVAANAQVAAAPFSVLNRATTIGGTTGVNGGAQALVTGDGLFAVEA